MKILASIIMLSLSISSVFAQAEWDENGSDIHNTNSGKVGIGTTTPEYRLTVNGEEGGDPSLLLRNSTFNSTHSAGTTSMQFAFGNHLGPKIEAFKNTFNTTGLNFYTEYGFSTPQLTMTIRPNGSGGNVGIGTGNPSAKLEVNGGLLSRMTNEGGWDIAFGTSEGNGLLIGKINGSTNTNADKAHILYRNANGGIYYGYNNSGVQTTVINSQNNGNTYFNSGGNVGIGTNNPDTKLTVKGTIHTQEVKVDLNGILAPDYVFGEAYDLPSLDQVQDYINTHKHLPEVPSAEEMEKNGLNLKEMNLLLLKKVEELTLYVIELKRENEKIKLFEEKIEKLETKIK